MMNCIHDDEIEAEGIGIYVDAKYNKPGERVVIEMPVIRKKCKRCHRIKVIPDWGEVRRIASLETNTIKDGV